MDGQDYLNQISAENRPIKKSRSGILHSKIFLISIIGVMAFLVIMIVGLAIGGARGSEKELSYALKLHINNTSEIINEYRPEVKSSRLRSESVSLSSILSNTDRELSDYLSSKNGGKLEEPETKLVDEAALNKDEVLSDLFQAKINGNLDRMYAHKISYDISLIMSEEVKLANTTNNDTLRALLTKSYNSLNTLYENFNSFSETK